MLWSSVPGSFHDWAFSSPLAPANPTDHSRSTSVWTAPSPGQLLISSPPTYSLPQKPGEIGESSVVFPSVQHHKSNNSAYFTAWGSPFSPQDCSPRYPLQGDILSSATDASSLRRWTHFSSKQRARDSSFANSSPLANRRSRFGYTRDWLQTDLTQANSSEKGNWWSDESDYSPSAKPSRLIGASPDPTADWLDLSSVTGPLRGHGPGLEDQFVPGSPDFNLDRSHQGRQDQDNKHLSKLPLRMLASKSTNPRLPTAFPVLDQKQIDRENTIARPPHFDRTVSEAPILSSASNIQDSPPKRSRTSISDSPSSQRLKKRVPWRGKTCIIALPIDSDKEYSRKLTLLKPECLSKRLREWQELGYDTAGFKLSPPESEDVTSEGQSRPIYPISTDVEHERQSCVYRVNIPDQLEWEAYVNRLKEEKLRALGVSFGDDANSTLNITPAIHTMSRNVSSQSSSITMSPSTASSLPTNAGHSVNQFPPMSSGVHGGSRIPFANAPNLQMPGNPRVSHFPRYSMAMPGGVATFAFPYPQQTPPLAGTLSPSQQLMSQSNSRGISPVVNGHTPNMSTFPKAASPVHHNPVTPVSTQDPQELFAHMQMQQALLQAHHLAQQHQQQQLLLANPPAITSRQSEGLHAALYTSQLDIASPLPRGHRQNLSETLQKEVEIAEAARDVPSRHESGFTPSGSESDAVAAQEETPLESLIANDMETDLPEAEIETNPSLLGSPMTGEGYVLPPQSNHRSKPSITGLNANAPVFEIRPDAGPVPEVFAFLGSQRPDHHLDMNAMHPNEEVKQPAQSGLNVAAPIFVPGNVSKRSLPSREFSFSSSGPVFKPDAPVFSPGGPGLGASENQPEGPFTNGNLKQIFGPIDLSDVIKPTKKSKAIPIVRPARSETDSGADSDGQEDESGRITQPEGRQKRIRRHDDGRDQIPQFATPSTAIMPAKFESVSPISAGNYTQKDITPLQNATHQLKEIIDDLPASEESSLSAEENDISVPFSFSNAQEAARFSVALPLVSPPIEHVNKKNLEVAHATLHAQEDFPIEPVFSASSLPGNDATDTPSAAPQASSMHHATIPAYNIGQRSGSSKEQELVFGPPSPPHSSDPPDEPQRPQHADRVDHSAITSVQDFETKPRMDGVTYLDPSFQEIDAIMKHLNNEDSDFGVERNHSPWRSRSPLRTPVTGILQPSASNQLLPPPQLRSDAPSPSPNRLQQPYQYLPPTESESADTADVEMVARNARYSPSYRPSRNDVHRLNSPGSQSIGDWDDAISSGDEPQLRARTNFFDNRVDALIGSIVQNHMGPLEKTLADIQASLTSLSSQANSRRPQRAPSDEFGHSDADDEDDEDGASTSRMKSPLRERKLDKLKASIEEIAAAQQSLAPATQLAEIVEVVKELKTSVQQAPGSTTNIKNIVEEAVGRQLRGRSGPVTSSHQSATAEKSQLQIAGLETMLKIAETRAEDELKARRATEDALADSQRLLRGALQEAAEQRESAEETERSLAVFHEERHEDMRQTALLEGSQDSLQRTVTDLAEKNAALESTLEEYRLSSTQWRAEIEDERYQNKNLNRTIDSLRSELDDGIKGRESLRTQILHLQDNMAQMSNDVARDQALRRNKEEELKSKLDILGSRLEAEARTKEKLEAEIDRLEIAEKDALKAQLMVEHFQRANTDLETLANQLRSESHGHQDSAARFEREFIDARESGKLETQRTRIALEADIEAANNQLNMIRADHEGTVRRLQAQIDDAATNSDTVKARYELMLEEASDSRGQALREAAEAREAALQEHYRFHERASAELRAEHERALSNSMEDKQRAENYLNQCLTLAEEKVVHYTDKVAHLEEKLGIAKSAAHAAVQAAQFKKPTSSPQTTRGSWNQATGLPEKISPQALRESILVLQEQLQEREGRIENLEQDLSLVDRNAPAKIKDQEMEITWLRELLGVRIDDLEDVIQTLSKPVYNREAVKDAAIRLKANLQMEQQEKERSMAGGQTFPSLSSISNLAASPRALPLAAAAAWGNWRNKARETPFHSLSAMSGNTNQTPSRSSPSTQSFLSGLMTPPNTKLRQTPPSEANGPASKPFPSSRRPPIPYRTPRQSFSTQSQTSPIENQRSPNTPPLMRKASYDQDAKSADFDEDTYGRGGEDEEPFGPSLGSILNRA